MAGGRQNLVSFEMQSKYSVFATASEQNFSHFPSPRLHPIRKRTPGAVATTLYGTT